MSEDERTRSDEGDEPVDREATDRAETEPVDPEEADLPLSELRKRMDAREEGAESPLSDLDTERTSEVDESELFEAVDVGDLDGEAVWDAMVEGDTDAAELLGEGPEIDDAEPAVEPTVEADEHVIDKREYCQRCEFFDDPPNATCTNGGTEIVELVDNDHFRVRNCPKVAVDDEALSGFAAEEE